MKISIVTPASRHSLTGNRVTAVRWARMFRDLGHQVSLTTAYGNQSCDLMVALHARRSFLSMKRFRTRVPKRPLILVLPGTDLYGNRSIKRALEWADRLIVLQPMGLRQIPKPYREKGRVIVQSFSFPYKRKSPKKNVFEICVFGHLRSVKDPFRAPLAARRLPAESKIQIVHVGKALSPMMKKRAQEEMKKNPRYRWLGELPRGTALRVLARSRLHVLSSKLEGGANAITEAIACGVPTVSSRIDGSVGILGRGYPGYFPVGDTQALSRLMERVEKDIRFYQKLRKECAKLKPRVKPSGERNSWKKLFEELESLR